MAWKPDYVLLTDVKAYLRIEDADDDNLIQRAITAASRAVDRHCRRQFGKVEAPELRTYHLDRGAGWTWYAVVDDVMTVDGLVLPDGVTASAWLPLNGPADGRPWTRVELEGVAGMTQVGPRPLIDITAPWGWDDVPTAVAEATLIQTARIVKRRDSPYGVAGSPELGNELRLLAKVDPDVAVLLTDYVRRGQVG